MLELETALKLNTPSAVAWSPDGQYIAYQVTGGAGSEIYLYSVVDKTTTTLVPHIPPYRYYKDTVDLRWTSDGQRVVYTTGRDFYTIRLTGGEPELLISGTLAGELVQLSPRQDKISFIRDGELWIQDVAGGLPRQLTRGERFLADDSDLFRRLYQWPQWSPDEAMIVYLAPTERSVKVVLISIEGEEMGHVVPEEDIWGQTHTVWSPDGRRIAVSRLSHDFRHKRLTIYDVERGTERELWLDSDDRWVDHNVNASFKVAWSHDGDRIAFLSNRDGWRHLYVAAVDTGDVRQMTDGDYELFWCGWSPDDEEILYISSQGHRQQWLQWAVPADDGPARQLVTGPGSCSSAYLLRSLKGAPAQPSPDGKKLVYSFSDPDEPFGLWMMETRGPAPRSKPIQVYSGLPEGMDAANWAHMEAVTFQSADGTIVPAALVTPHALRTDREHPALVHMYGGWGQMATLGWGLLFKSTLFNYLANQGYVILIVDPRGSEGYGDAYAKALYREGGGVQVQDLVAGARYLAGLGYVDPESIGIFGHSYGAYLAVQTMVQAPDVFAAGIALAGVFDWATYGGYGTYTRIRFGTPDDSPNLLRARSVIEHVGALEGALLVVHGSGDFNAPIAGSEALVNALLKAGKEFDYMVYPGEPHSWVKPEVHRDFFARTERFLDRYLRRNS
jgi:dipeptidyl-peptidase-4